MSGEDSRGGGAQGSHGRRRLPLGHIRAILSRAQANTWVGTTLLLSLILMYSFAVSSKLYMLGC
jgi:hypothetical protein